VPTQKNAPCRLFFESLAAFARDVEISAVGSISSSQMAGQSATGAALACP